MTKENKNGYLLKFIIFGLLISSILFTYAVTYRFFQAFPGSDKPEYATWGQIGDFFGGILNPIYGFLGFIALLTTIVIQAKEMELSRKEAQSSSAALKEQVEHLKKESLKNDLQGMIKLVSDELAKMVHVEISFTLSGLSKSRPIYKVFGPHKEEMFFNLLSGKDVERDSTVKKQLIAFSELLSELALYIRKFRENGGDSSLWIYFASRYGHYATNLFEKGYITEEDKNTLAFPIRSV